VSQQDVVKNVSKGIIVGGAAVVVFMCVIFLAASIFGSNDAQESKDLRSERIKPLGQINVVNEGGVVAQAPVKKPVVNKTEKPAKSGQEVYKSVCSACHTIGIVGAPKFGDKDMWAPRIAKGEANLIQHAINGLNAMPPRGGNPDLSDEEIKGAVHHMLKAVGVKSTEAATKKPITPVIATSSTPSDNLALGKKIYQSTCNACHGIGIVGAPKFGDKEAWKSRVAQGMKTLFSHALNGFQGKTGVMPPKGGATNVSDTDIKAAVAYMVSKVK
jgi:cytochrome c5